MFLNQQQNIRWPLTQMESNKWDGSPKAGEYKVLLGNTRVAPDAMSPREKMADHKANMFVAGPPYDPSPYL